MTPISKSQLRKLVDGVFAAESYRVRMDDAEVRGIARNIAQRLVTDHSTGQDLHPNWSVVSVLHRRRLGNAPANFTDYVEVRYYDQSGYALAFQYFFMFDDGHYVPATEEAIDAAIDAFHEREAEFSASPTQQLVLDCKGFDAAEFEALRDDVNCAILNLHEVDNEHF